MKEVNMKLRTLAIFSAGFLGCLGLLALLAWSTDRGHLLMPSAEAADEIGSGWSPTKLTSHTSNSDSLVVSATGVITVLPPLMRVHVSFEGDVTLAGHTTWYSYALAIQMSANGGSKWTDVVKSEPGCITGALCNNISISDRALTAVTTNTQYRIAVSFPVANRPTSVTVNSNARFTVTPD